MNQNFLVLQFLSAFLLVVPPSLHAGQVYIPVGEAKVKKSIVAFPDFKYEAPFSRVQDSKGIARTIKDLIIHDLDFTNLLTFQSSSAFIENGNAGITLETFRLSDWSAIGTEFLIKTSISQTLDKLNLEVRLYDVIGKKQIFGKRYAAKQTEALILAHTAANELIEALTGKKGIFFTKIVMVCDKTGKKEIWISDFDGSNPRVVTHHGTLAFSPAWSIDNKRIAYSVYTKNSRNVKNIDLYELDLKNGHSKLLSNRPGINSGAIYSPDRRRLALTMSFLGNPEIFFLDPIARTVTRITRSLGVDVDPDFSPDGKKIAFVSTRSNQPMVYLANIDGSNVTRVTFAGELNATPRFSPNGSKIVFAGYNDKHFDLFTINTDGSNLERLTKNEGSNEDPDYSPDGNFIAFSSKRTGQKNVYVISADGMTTRRLTYGLGSCEAPRWSHY